MHRISVDIGRPLDITVRASTRARRMSLRAEAGVGIIAVVPFGTRLEALERFVRQQTAWIARMLKLHQDVITLPRTKAEYVRRAPEAMRLARDLIVQLNAHYRFKVGRVSVRNQTSRWGSCGRSGDITLNWKIAAVPRELAEYVVAHELCHIGSFDHSPRFWALVAETIPDWKARRAALKRYRL